MTRGIFLDVREFPELIAQLDRLPRQYRGPSYTVRNHRAVYLQDLPGDLLSLNELSSRFGLLFQGAFRVGSSSM